MTIYSRIAKDRMTKDIANNNRSMLGLIQSIIMIDTTPMDDEQAIKVMREIQGSCLKNFKLYDEKGYHKKAQEELAFFDLMQRYLPDLPPEEVPKEPTDEDIEMTLAKLNLPRTVRSMKPLMAALKEEFNTIDGKHVRNLLMGE